MKTTGNYGPNSFHVLMQKNSVVSLLHDDEAGQSHSQNFPEQ